MKAANDDDEFNRANAAQAAGDLLGLTQLGGGMLPELVRWFGILFCFVVTGLLA